MKFEHHLNKPEYFHRPTQILRRIWRGITALPPSAKVQLPWGSSLFIRPTEVVGRALWFTGAFELAVSEMIWRILRPGDLAADVGANIGYHTSLMALRVSGKGGTVRAFEAHPAIFGELTSNRNLWPPEVQAGVHLKHAAVSGSAGEVILHVPREFSENRGVASVEPCAAKLDTDQVSVRAVRLDDEFPAHSSIRLVKMDIEGHELTALTGAQRMLREGLIRSLIFEEHGPLPSPVTQLLAQAGYRLFKILKSPGGPRLEDPNGPTPPLPFEAPNYLATLDPAEILSLARSPGWRCFRRTDLRMDR